MTDISTGGKMGTMEHLVAQSVSGVVWSIFAGRRDCVADHGAEHGVSD